MMLCGLLRLLKKNDVLKLPWLWFYQVFEIFLSMSKFNFENNPAYCNLRTRRTKVLFGVIGFLFEIYRSRLIRWRLYHLEGFEQFHWENRIDFKSEIFSIHIVKTLMDPNVARQPRLIFRLGYVLPDDFRMNQLELLDLNMNLTGSESMSNSTAFPLEIVPTPASRLRSFFSGKR